MKRFAAGILAAYGAEARSMGMAYVNSHDTALRRKADLLEWALDGLAGDPSGRAGLKERGLAPTRPARAWRYPVAAVLAAGRIGDTL